MISEPDFNELFHSLYKNAYENFQYAPQYDLLQEKREKMDLDCETLFAKPELEFVIQCFETLLEFEGQRAEHIYEYGLKDCIAILKKLEIL